MNAQSPAPPSEVLATYAPRTKKTPANMFPTPARTRITQSHVRLRTSRHPSCRSWRNGRAGSFSCGGRRSWARKPALAAKLAESTASAHPGLAAATITPAIAGPATLPIACARARRAFACCSRASLTVAGTSAVDAGLKNAVAVP